MENYKIHGREIEVLRIAGNTIMYKYVDNNHCEIARIDTFEIITENTVDVDYYESSSYIDGKFF